MQKTKKAMVIAVCIMAIAALAVVVGCSSPQVSRETQEKPQVTSEASTSSVAATTPSNDPFWVFIVGNDTRLGTVDIEDEKWADGNARSDTMMIARVDPKNYKISIVTIPRDTAADVDGDWTKINYGYQYRGMEGAIDQVKALCGITPDYYMNMTFVQFEDFVDALGGLTVNVPVVMDELYDIVTGDEDVDLEPGEQTLDGKRALVMARTRHAYDVDQDAYRQINDRALVVSAIKKVLNKDISVDLACDAMMKNVDTNFKAEDLKYYMQEFVDHADDVTIYTGTGPYAGDIDPQAELWMAFRDEDTWHSIIEAMENGEDPNDVFPSLTF